MSTRSYICIENENKSISGIYCHSDGYLTYNGAMLLDHYSDREKVKELINNPYEKIINSPELLE